MKEVETRDLPPRVDTKPAFSGKGFILEAQPIEVLKSKSPIYEHMLRPWNPEFYQVPRTPIAVGEIKDKKTFSREAPEIVKLMSSMPIKLPGESTYHIPIELKQFEEAIQMFVNHVAATNPDLKEKYFAYVSTQQSLVEAQTTQRLPGAHVDGLQIATFPNTVPPELTCVAVDFDPTTFYPGQTIDFTGIKPTPQAYSKAIREQSDQKRAVQGLPYVGYLFDSYFPHSTTLATEDMTRTLIRVEFSQRDYQTPDVLTGNRPVVNPLFAARQSK